jgi:protoporphyrin/coproporphyrin ferrochelatase
LKHIETLEEIDLEYRELAEESGVENWRRCPALNTDEAFIDDMADLVIEALTEPVQTVTEACVANMVRDVELTPIDERLGINMAGIQGVGGTASIAAVAALGGDLLGVVGVGSSSGFSRKLQDDNLQSLPPHERYRMEQQQLREKERLNARVAMIGVVITILIELFNGKSFVNLFHM